jgi:hypothetical protein
MFDGACRSGEGGFVRESVSEVNGWRKCAVLIREIMEIFSLKISAQMADQIYFREAWN